ncbi:MAG: cytochrome c [Breznakibacter sp.]
MKPISWVAMVLAAGIVVASCGGPSGQKAGTAASSQHYDAENGRNVYVKHCQVCHQAQGQGVPKMFPPLTENPRLRENANVLIDVLLNGMSGEIVVNGEVYNGIMSPYRNLSDKEIADVLNYIRFGLNGYGIDAVLPEAVADLRKKN